MRHCEQEPGKTWKVHEFWVENMSEKTLLKNVETLDFSNLPFHSCVIVSLETGVCKTPPIDFFLSN